MFELAAYFHKGDHVQRVQAHRAVQADVKAIEAAQRLFEDLGLSDDGDSFTDVDIEDIAAHADDKKLWRHIVHGKTRCWSTVDSAESILCTRASNDAFFLKRENMSDAAYNLSPSEYLALPQIIGIMSDVVDVERYIEGFMYGTVSIVHPLTCCLRATFQSGTIFSLDVDEPQGDRIQMLESDLEPMAKTVLKYAAPEILRIFGEEPSTTEECV